MTPVELTNENRADMRLILRVDNRRLSALIVGSETIDPAVASIVEDLSEHSVKAFENAVYDNPMLLGDFAAIDIIFSTPEIFVIPSSANELTEEIAAALLPDSTGGRIIMHESAGKSATIGYAVDSELLNFLKRTFACAEFHHSLAVTANWLMQNEPAGFYGLVNGPGDLALCSVGANGFLRVLNRPQPAGANDCAYYILATSQSDESVTVMTIDPEMRSAITDTITKVKHSTRLTAPSLPERLLYLRRRAPEVAFDMLFITQL